MRTLPHCAALALGALVFAGAPAMAHEDQARAAGAVQDAPGATAGACPDTGIRERSSPAHSVPASPVGGAAVAVVLGADPEPQAAALPVACTVLSTSEVPGMPDGRAGPGLDGAARSGNLGALVVAGAGALSVVGSAVVAQRRTAAQH